MSDERKRLCGLLNNNQKICGLTAQTNDETNYWDANGGYCDEIRVVRVAGQSGYVPWFEIRKAGVVVSLVNAAFVYDVIYAESGDGA